MTTVGPNFLIILTEAIKQAGAENDSATRANIYARARRTVVERARLSGTSDTAVLEQEIDAAIAQIETDLGNLPVFQSATRRSTETPTAAAHHATDLHGTGGAEAATFRRQSRAAVAYAMPETEDLADNQFKTAGYAPNVVDLDAASGSPSTLPPSTEGDAIGQGLDRVAADLAAGFRELREEFDRESQLADMPGRTAAPQGPSSDEPNAHLASEVGKLVRDSGNDNTPQARGQALARQGLNQARDAVAALLSAMRPGVVVAAILALLVVGAGAYFTINPQPANPAFAPPEPPPPPRLIPDQATLDGDGWVARDVQIDAATGLSWTGYVIRDTADDRFGTLAAPLNDIAAPKGFRISLRVKKSDQRLPHFASMRVTAPFTRRAYTLDAMIDLTTGEIQAAGNAKAENISVIDDGDSWRLSLNAPLQGSILFSKPRLEIFPAAGSDVGTYDAAATGEITVGDITVEAL